MFFIKQKKRFVFVLIVCMTQNKSFFREKSSLKLGEDALDTKQETLRKSKS